MTRNFRSLVLPDVIAVRGMLVAWLTLAVSLLITLWAWQLAQVNVERNAHDRFYFRIDEVKIAIADRLRDYEAVLRGAQGLFNASDEVTWKEWRAYVQSLKLDQVYPGIQGIGFARRVSSPEKDAHIRKIRAEDGKHHSRSVCLAERRAIRQPANRRRTGGWSRRDGNADRRRRGADRSVAAVLS